MLPTQRPWSVSHRRSLALILLCAVQSCERFAFLALLPLFVLYAHDRHAMPAPTALGVLAVFQTLSYVGGWPGGWLIDRTLGARASTLLGAVLLACGYGVLTLDGAVWLWPALGLMGIGHSLLKPGLLVLLSRVGGKEARGRERAFLWHYLAVNVGHVAGALFGEWAHARHGWPSLFVGATAASVLGCAALAIGMPWLRGEAGQNQATSAELSSAPASERMRAVWLLCGVAVVFWLTAQQAGSSLTMFAATSTVQQVVVFGRTLPIGPGHFASLHGLIVLAMLPAFLMLHRRHDAVATSPTGKLCWGYLATSAAFVLMTAAGLHGGDVGRVSGAWLVGCYLLLSVAEILLSPLGLSLITQLAPKTKAAQSVGLWFAGSALGNGLAGALGLCWDRWPHHRSFALLSILSLGAAAVLLLRRRKLDWLTAHSTGASSQPPTPSPTSAPALPALASLAILLPGLLIPLGSLPLPVRGASAIVCGLAVLLGGPVLFSHALAWLVRRTAVHDCRCAA